jgi:hypothetical protein
MTVAHTAEHYLKLELNPVNQAKKATIDIVFTVGGVNFKL